jgi:hypothetical protein
VLEPHYDSLFAVLKVDYPEPIIEILKHTKTDYLTFWIYGLLCAKFPLYPDLERNIKQLILKQNLDIDI